MSDLDSQAVDTAIRLFLKKHERHGEAFADASTEELLDAAGVTVNGHITPTAIILLGKPESVHLLSGVMPRITWTLYASDDSVAAYEHFEPPFLLAVDRVLGKVRNERYRFLANGESLFPVELSQYEPDIIRELLHNCLAHRSYLELGNEVHLDIYDDRMTATSPRAMVKGPLPADVMTAEVESHRRNPIVCDVLGRMHLMERRDTGLREICSATADGDAYQVVYGHPVWQLRWMSFFLNKAIVLPLSTRNASFGFVSQPSAWSQIAAVPDLQDVLPMASVDNKVAALSLFPFVNKNDVVAERFADLKPPFGGC